MVLMQMVVMAGRVQYVMDTLLRPLLTNEEDTLLMRY